MAQRLHEFVGNAQSIRWFAYVDSGARKRRDTDEECFCGKSLYALTATDRDGAMEEIRALLFDSEPPLGDWVDSLVLFHVDGWENACDEVDMLQARVEAAREAKRQAEELAVIEMAERAEYERLKSKYGCN